MKLYATTTSERATKGQGGNELMIEIMGEKKELIARVQVTRPSYIEYEINVFPVIYRDKLMVDVKGHGYRLKNIETACKSMAHNEDIRLHGHCLECQRKVVKINHCVDCKSPIEIGQVSQRHCKNCLHKKLEETKGEKKKGDKCAECGETNFCKDCGGCVYCTKACKNTVDSHNA